MKLKDIEAELHKCVNSLMDEDEDWAYSDWAKTHGQKLLNLADAVRLLILRQARYTIRGASYYGSDSLVENIIHKFDILTGEKSPRYQDET